MNILICGKRTGWEGGQSPKLREELKARGVGVRSGLKKSELILRLMGREDHLDYAKALHFVNLDQASVSVLPPLSYDQLRTGFALPSTAKAGVWYECS